MPPRPGLRPRAARGRGVAPRAASAAASALFAAWLAAAPVAAQDYADGQAAYEARDWAAAEALWLEEAESGSGAALLGLGNLYDFGLLGAPSPERAFAYYERAAQAGVPEAAFNVGVMHDAGIGTPVDPDLAEAWYAFAGLSGHARAQYNAGLLSADPGGGEGNPDVAAYWLGRAADTLPAAQDALAALEPASATGDGPAAPDPLAARVFRPSRGPELRIAWRPAAAPPGATYYVEVIRLGTEELQRLGAARTEGSGAAVRLADPDQPFAWRVAQVVDDAYAASSWQPGPGAVLIRPPGGAVRFEYAADDRRAAGLAQRLGGALARGGIMVSHRPLDTAPQASRVVRGYGSDAGLASDVAAFLPGLDDAAVLAEPDAELAPGEVAVVLSFAAVPEEPPAPDR